MNENILGNANMNENILGNENMNENILGNAMTSYFHSEIS